ncbi:hypothetical protein ACH4PU_12570 [Streptomyces sp. NPDC021100]|uniref:hypothetical protein n=1 Tax=Streptomyces sp. NPDC021100 TaxID=3365114 RepID=UPI0037A5DAEF
MPLGEPSVGAGRRAKAVAVAAATTVVVTAGVTGSLLVGGGGNAGAAASGSPGPAASVPASASVSTGPRVGAAERPVIPGWKVVVNPDFGTAFDVPPDWDVKPPDTRYGFLDSKLDPEDPANWRRFTVLATGFASLRDDWCVPGIDANGRVVGTELAGTGTTGAEGAKDTAHIAVNKAAVWVYGGYTQPDKKSIVSDRTAKPYTTTSGVQGSIAWARSRNAPRKNACSTDGKAIAFGFRNSAGNHVAWCLYGATGVRDELPDSTIMKILGTVRLHGKPRKS